MPNNCVSKKAIDQLFRKCCVQIGVILSVKKIDGSTYDKFRNIGIEKKNENPIFVCGLVRSLTGNSLIIRNMGLTETGAVEIKIKTKDVNLIRISESIIINNKEYYAFDNAVGNKLQIFDLPFGYTKVILFRKDK